MPHAARGATDSPEVTRIQTQTYRRCESARARPTASSPGSARPGTRPAAPAVAWSESSGPGSRIRVLRLVLAAGPSVPHLRTD